MDESERVEQADAETGGTRTEVVASTLEALQARVERADREALRGAIAFNRPPAAGAQAGDEEG
ncbi:MAG TPA: hypothetical protein VEB43_09485 [Anaeromyxobacter sp.]|nr:hypothetical protein [Anaeromyxobacter sp.]